MVEIKKIGDEYFIEYYAQGLLFRKKGGKTIDQAQQVLKQIKDSLPDPHRWYASRQDPLEDCIETIRQIISKEYSLKVSQRLGRVLDHFKSFCHKQLPQHCYISQITPAVIEQYKAYLLNNITIKNQNSRIRHAHFTLLLLKEIFDLAINSGTLNDNPVIHIKFLGQENRKNFCNFDSKTIYDILSQIIGEYQLAALLIYETGLSFDKIKRLKLKNINGNHLVLSDGRSFPLSPRLRQQINQERSPAKLDGVSPAILSKNLTISLLNEALTQATFKTGRNGAINAIILKNLFVKNLIEKGLSLKQLMKWTGFVDLLRLNFFVNHIFRAYQQKMQM